MPSESVHQKSNRLVNEKSPYLLQHAYNPVDWYPWADEAFKVANELNRPIFLSIGYREMGTVHNHLCLLLGKWGRFTTIYAYYCRPVPAISSNDVNRPLIF